MHFLAAAGIGVLVVAYAEITARARFGLATLRLLTLLNVDDVIALYRTVDDALNDVCGAGESTSPRAANESQPSVFGDSEVFGVRP